MWDETRWDAPNPKVYLITQGRLVGGPDLVHQVNLLLSAMAQEEGILNDLAFGFELVQKGFGAEHERSRVLQRLQLYWRQDSSCGDKKAVLRIWERASQSNQVLTDDLAAIRRALAAR